MIKLKLILPLALAALVAGCNDSDQPNVAPILGANSFVTDTDVVIMDRLIATDKNGDSLVFSLNGSAQNGNVTLAADGSFSYTPALEFTGTDNFTVQVSDGELSTTGQVSITVNVAVVSFLDYSRTAFGQDAGATPLAVNGRDFTQDATSEADYADLLTGQ